MLVPTLADFRRISAGWSEVAITTTERLSPSSFKSFSRKERTSRPRSPISTITFTSAVAFFAIIPKRVLLPTPLPAKMPILCPMPSVNSESIAFTPSGSTSLIGARFSGLGGWLSIGYVSCAISSPLSSIGSPNTSITLPKSSMPTGTRKVSPVETTLSLGATPLRSPSGIKSSLFSLKPTTSASILELFALL
ncbi:MAG: hypothetical protein BWY62_01263 [Firmicutes bacterium ADurb.Bin356]|nr:MAG: hypothetical protein BWY62_01263 [Firmicutes bacterium ADurb.Bin356]